jgi:hypothetical protein
MSANLRHVEMGQDGRQLCVLLLARHETKSGQVILITWNICINLGGAESNTLAPPERRFRLTGEDVFRRLEKVTTQSTMFIALVSMTSPGKHVTSTFNAESKTICCSPFCFKHFSNSSHVCQPCNDTPPAHLLQYVYGR